MKIIIKWRRQQGFLQQPIPNFTCFHLLKRLTNWLQLRIGGWTNPCVALKVLPPKDIVMSKSGMLVTSAEDIASLSMVDRYLAISKHSGVQKFILNWYHGEDIEERMSPHPKYILSVVYHFRTHSITSSWASEGQVPCCLQDLQEEVTNPKVFEKWVNRRWKQEWDKGGGKKLWKVWATPALAEGILEVWEQLWAQTRGMSPYLTNLGGRRETHRAHGRGAGAQSDQEMSR